MTANLDIANRALQLMGSRTNMTQTEFNNQSSNEAIQSNLIMFQLRDELNRMAPWDCVQKWANLTYIATLPGNPENPNAGSPLWQPGQPPIPWAYEYQYPVDCMRARKITPQFTTQAGGVPIYPAGTVTGAGQVGWTGPALKFKIGTDAFFSVNSASVAAGGSGYAVGDTITLAQPTFTFTQNTAPVGQPPANQTFTFTAGAPAQLQVTAVAAGVITAVSVVNVVQGETSSSNTPSGGVPLGGSYFAVQQTNPVTQGSTSGSGTGATFNLVYTSTQFDQRVLLCNQTQAILTYNKQVTDPNVMDPLFQDAWAHILGARLCSQLSGEKSKANELIALTNNMIMEARKADGNEGITVNDVTPDFIRTRGSFGVGPNYEYSPNMDFYWGSFYSPY